MPGRGGGEHRRRTGLSRSEDRIQQANLSTADASEACDATLSTSGRRQRLPALGWELLPEKTRPGLRCQTMELVRSDGGSTAEGRPGSCRCVDFSSCGRVQRRPLDGAKMQAGHGHSAVGLATPLSPLFDGGLGPTCSVCTMANGPLRPASDDDRSRAANPSLAQRLGPEICARRPWSCSSSSRASNGTVPALAARRVVAGAGRATYRSLPTQPRSFALACA
ncbi:uncharacterized protein PSFLO_04341 [Pseudozyma flocculosa]|uniref:Uncharacterized protein n=1 Tax=Pseudozyma flocculosa TaxID=84751 RepID=A0A5C3F3F0_9BASI|nr:uncharacterized protein PSFLO_04341 [Pseudozyma flocculosa]